VRPDHIDTVHLSFFDWPTGLNLLALRHVTLTNNLVALKNFSSFPASIRSIQILLHDNMPNFVSCNWSTLRSLSALPMLSSLHIVLNDMTTPLDDISCQIIAEIVPMFVHFGLCFRSQVGKTESDESDSPADLDTPRDFEIDDTSFSDDVFDDYRTSIEELRRRILLLPLHLEAIIIVEEEGCGLTVWL
jgi:hypothetical protein